MAGWMDQKIYNNAVREILNFECCCFKLHSTAVNSTREHLQLIGEKGQEKIHNIFPYITYTLLCVQLTQYQHFIVPIQY